MLDSWITKKSSKHVNIFNKILTAWIKPTKTLVVLSQYEMIQKLRTKIQLTASFNWIQLH